MTLRKSIVCPPTEILCPSALIVRDWPVEPRGTVNGAAEDVRAMARYARMADNCTIIECGRRGEVVE